MDQALIGGKSSASRDPNVRRTGYEMVYPHLSNRCEASRSTTTYRSHSCTGPPRLAVAESEGRVRIFDWSFEEVYVPPLPVLLKYSESPANTKTCANYRMCPSGRPMSLTGLVESSSSRVVRLLIASPRHVLISPPLHRNDDSLVVSLSNGDIALISPGETGFVLATRFHAHEYEPWCAAWDYWDRNIVYSGMIHIPFFHTQALLSCSKYATSGRL